MIRREYWFGKSIITAIREGKCYNVGAKAWKHTLINIFPFNLYRIVKYTENSIQSFL